MSSYKSGGLNNKYKRRNRMRSLLAWAVNGYASQGIMAFIHGWYDILYDLYDLTEIPKKRRRSFYKRLKGIFVLFCKLYGLGLYQLPRGSVEAVEGATEATEAMPAIDPTRDTIAGKIFIKQFPEDTELFYKASYTDDKEIGSLCDVFDITEDTPRCEIGKYMGDSKGDSKGYGTLFAIFPDFSVIYIRKEASKKVEGKCLLSTFAVSKADTMFLRMIWLQYEPGFSIHGFYHSDFDGLFMPVRDVTKVMYEGLRSKIGKKV